MKRFLPLLIVLVAFVSCQEDVTFNDPGFQGVKDNVMWRGNNARAYISSNGSMEIQAFSNFETVTLNTSSFNVGTYLLGTTNVDNTASYSFDSQDVTMEYATVAVLGPAGGISLVSGGKGYSSDTGVLTEASTGSGSGMTVNIVTNASGVVTSATIATRGNGYLAGDIITVVDGVNSNCQIKVENVQNSNGEIQITEYDKEKMTVSGKFKFNAINLSKESSEAPIVNFQYGEFYRIPVYPAP